MAFTINQILSASYTAILNDARKPENQWAESAYLRELESQGMLKRINFGPTLEATLDVRRNPGGAFLDTDLQAISTAKTEVLSAASYTPAQMSVPITWSKMDEVQNPEESQKVDLVKSLTQNALDTHDDLIEQALFATSTSGFLGLLTHIPDTGQSSDGGIDSAVEAVWRSQQATYLDDTDIEAAFTSVWNACTKGSGSKLMPTLMVSDGTTQALFEGTQQALQRYADQDFKAGAKTLMFKTCRYVFSQYGGTRVYFQNPKSFRVVVSKAYFRDLSKDQEFEGANGFTRKIYSALQSVTNNRSRLGVAHL